MRALFTATRRFDARDGERWTEYIRWSQLQYLREVVSLDVLLCPNVIGDLTPEDWEHNVHENFKLHLFRDVDYVRRRTEGQDRVQILALMLNPTENDLRSFPDPRFQFCGFDLVESGTGISALVNCRGFDNAFSAEDLSDCGLVPEYSFALALQERLRRHYPEEPHADCQFWAIWKMLR